MSILCLLKDFLNKLKIKYKKLENINIPKSIPKILKKSLSLRIVDAGSDESLIAEFNSLGSPEYSLGSYGIHFAASPKHADGLVILGSITQNMKEAVLQSYEVMPSPKIIIAIGDHSLDGDKRFPTTIGTNQLFPGKYVYHIPGNSPTAKDIFNYLVSLTK